MILAGDIGGTKTLLGLFDSRTARPQLLALIGQHGSLTAAEQLVPLLMHGR